MARTQAQSLNSPATHPTRSDREIRRFEHVPLDEFQHRVILSDAKIDHCVFYAPYALKNKLLTAAICGPVAFWVEDPTRMKHSSPRKLACPCFGTLIRTTDMPL